MRPVALALFAGLLAGPALVPAGLIATAHAQDAVELPTHNWSFSGPFGTYDRAAAQRGFQVYKEVCSACHSMSLVHYRDLAGIGFDAKQIAAIAATVEVPGGINDDGEPFTRKGLPSDFFKAPFANDKAARAANNGALPPDQSVLLNAREGGANYIYDLLTGYADPPADMKMGDGMNYNKYFPGHQIAMGQPLHDDQVTYSDGTKATLEQEARDVTTFLAYVANPEMEERKRLGVKAIVFLVLLTGVTYAVKRRVWADVDH